jgi:hypothetical protein
MSMVDGCVLLVCSGAKVRSWPLADWAALFGLLSRASCGTVSGVATRRMPLTSRLAAVDHELAERILAADAAACRSAAAAAAGWAVRSAGLDNPRVDVFLTRDAASTTNVALRREALRAVVDELDEAVWDLQDQIEDGTALDDDYLRAFGETRAASAVYEATGEDPHLVALEAVYEARMVVDDPGPPTIMLCSRSPSRCPGPRDHIAAPLVAKSTKASTCADPTPAVARRRPRTGAPRAPGKSVHRLLALVLLAVLTVGNLAWLVRQSRRPDPVAAVDSTL